MTRRHFGSVRKLPSGRYQASYWWEGSRHIAATTFPTKADALAFVAVTEADLHRGAWVDPAAGRETVRSYAEKWLTQRTGLAVRTVELYRYLLDDYILPTFGDAGLVDVKPSAVRAWHGEHSRVHPSTAAKAYRLLSSIMRTAVADERLVRSPCVVKGAAVENAPERPVASVAEVEALADAMPEHLRIVVLLAAWCQLRRGELLGLRRRDVDLMRGTITIAVTRTRTMGNKIITKAPKTTAGSRTVAVPSNVLPVLKQHLELRVGSSRDAPVIVGREGRPLIPQVLSKSWESAREKVGRADLRLHDLRHTGLTWSAATGATTAELMRRAGHASPAAAMRYQHATADRDKALAEALAGLATPGAVAPIRGRTRRSAS